LDSRFQPTQAPSPDPIAPQTYRVLLIDDDEDEFVLTRDLVEETEVLQPLDWVDDHIDAEKHLLQEAYDCFLLDYYLGSRTGVELLQAVREKGCRAPIIILTGRDGDGIDLEALEAGATDYLEKGKLTSVILERAVRYAVRQQQNQNRLEDLVEQVSRLEQLKTDMIRIAAHDLRNPLTVMSGSVEMLRSDLKDQLDEFYLGYLDQLKTSIKHMQKMVADILSLERIAELSGGHTNPVNFSKTIEDSFSHFLCDTHIMTLNLPDDPVTVYGVAALLREAVDNLLSNALKYTPSGGQIEVSLTVDSDSALLKVSDTGFGIPEGMQDNLFSPFTRIKTQETRKIEGTGLGLHLVSNIVERHNGSVFFESEHGKGSTFGFMLPQMGEATS
jgi:signal transduction histidine kinase